MALRIITDSTSEITQEQAKALNITVIPLTVSFGNTVFTDGIDITNEEFYQRMRGVKELPKTSLINVATFTEVFEKFDDADDIVGIFISSELSGSLQSAHVAAASLPHKKIHLIDSRQVTFGLAALVHAAIGFRDAGDDAMTLVTKIQEIKTRIVLLAVIDDLKYLKLGGRLSSTSAAVGSLMHVKPLIAISDGKVVVVHKAFGLPRAFNWMCDQYNETDIDSSLPQFYGHSDAFDTLAKFIKFVNKHTKFPDARVFPIGITVGTHAGPGAVGFCFFKKK